MKKHRTIAALFSFPGFVASARLVGVFGDRYARVIKLRRRKKRRCVRSADSVVGVAMTDAVFGFAICRWRAGESIWSSNAGASTVQGVAACM